MKVILQETLEGVGDLGDLLDVSNGFARNYLLPRKKAVEANSRNIKEFEHAKRAAAEKAKKEKQEIEAHGKAFDPNMHEAVAQEPSDVVGEGAVLRVTRRGFRLKDRLLRPSSVIVSSGPVKKNQTSSATQSA